MVEIRGIIPPIVTPFDGEQEVDEKRLRRHISFLIERGVHGIFTCGSTGEFFLLTLEERKEVMEIVVDQVGGRIPVFGNIGYPGTKETIECARTAKDVGVDAVFCSIPYQGSPTQEGIHEHFKKIAQSVDLPVLVYNFPAAFGVNMEPETLANLANEKLVVGLKESNRDPLQLALDVILAGDRIAILTGEDDFICQALLLGAKGGILAMANLLPDVLVRLYDAVRLGNYERARSLQLSIIPLIKDVLVYGETWPSGLKEAMNMSGLDVGTVRSPLLPVKEENKAKIKQALDEYSKRKIV